MKKTVYDDAVKYETDFDRDSFTIFEFLEPLGAQLAGRKFTHGMVIMTPTQHPHDGWCKNR